MSFASYTDRIESAVQKAENGSEILNIVANGDEFTEAPTTSGPVPSLKKWQKDNMNLISGGVIARVDKAILSYPDYAAASAAAATLPEGQQVNVEDEKKRYSVASGALQYVRKFGERSVYLDDYLIAPVASVAAAMELAAMAAGEGGVVKIPPGRFTITSSASCLPVMFEGQGQGGTVLVFDMAGGARNGVVFSAPSATNCEMGARNLSIELINGNGLTCWTTPSGPYIDKLAKVTFEHISYSSERTSAADDSFACKYGWEFCHRLGDSFCMTLTAIDALGCYVTESDPDLQFLDGFVRFQPNDGILSCRITNVTTHNVANAFELRGRTYFSAAQVDVARAYRGFYDASDRVFDPSNPYAYGECAFNFVIVNAQKSCWDLKYRYLTDFTNCTAARTADAFDAGAQWHGFNLPYARGCKLHGVHAGGGDGLSGEQVGFNFEGGSGCDISGVSLGVLSKAFRMSSSVRPVEGTDSGPVRAMSISNVSLLGNVGTMFDMVHVRDLGVTGVRTGNAGGYTVTTLLANSNQATNTFLMQDIDGIREYQPEGSRLLWQNPGSPSGGRTWRWSLSGNTLSLLAANDGGTAGNNALIIERDTGTQNVKRVEFRAQAAGGFVLFTTSESQFSGLIKPTIDNSTDVGTAAFRIKQYYGVNGSISTSDEREKQQWRDQSDAEKAAALEIKSIIRSFKWTNAVNEKGEAARWHWGVGAQTVEDILRKHGIDPATQAYWCYDEWDEQLEIKDEDGSVIQEYRPAGNRYGIRYDELAMFILAAL